MAFDPKRLSDPNYTPIEPEKLTDPKLLRNLLKHAQKARRDDLVLRCQVQLANLEGAKHKTELEREFWSAVAVAEELASATNGKTTRLNRTRQKVDRVGVKQCLEDWAFHKGTTQGFDILVEGGYPALTGEAIVVRHAIEFSSDAVAAARDRLIKAGIDLAKI